MTSAIRRKHGRRPAHAASPPSAALSCAGVPPASVPSTGSALLHDVRRPAGRLGYAPTAALAPTAVEGRPPRGPALKSDLAQAIDSIAAYERQGPRQPGDPDETAARLRADVLAMDYLGVAEVVVRTDLTLRSAYQAGIRGPELVEFCLEVAWRTSGLDRGRPPQFPVPGRHRDR